MRSPGNELVLNAMRLAERAHRNKGQLRKAPEGEDRPSYFIHLAEVGFLLQEAGYGAEVVAAGYLHDMIEDCGYSVERLAEAIGNSTVADLVNWVSEPDKDVSWEERNSVYLERMKRAPAVVLSLSCADKTSNLRDMGRLIDKGYTLEDFLSRGAEQQREKFNALEQLYAGSVPDSIFLRFRDSLRIF